MSVRFADGTIILEGECQVDEAEPLLEFLLADPGAPVDWAGCTYLHTSLIQVLLAVRPRVINSPQSEFVLKWVVPTLNCR
ncbi:hypothetical protein IGS68_11290 [Skermanella sp. TT6]|uniref:Uncharacterized protein n=1 Tax=Skermanella cutis TaxID=2775420 RepID=A0ABX7BH01_9PROT|nr:STAS domain-containing protein [Skermanella sp. TT6]QQP91742.1 hypothetical protein IGS68_11290 [Skermanella sp. TT6]